MLVLNDPADGNVRRSVPCPPSPVWMAWWRCRVRRYALTSQHEREQDAHRPDKRDDPESAPQAPDGSCRPWFEFPQTGPE